MGIAANDTDLAKSAFLQATLPFKVKKSNVRFSLMADIDLLVSPLGAKSGHFPDTLSA